MFWVKNSQSGDEESFTDRGDAEEWIRGQVEDGGYEGDDFEVVEGVVRDIEIIKAVEVHIV